MLKNEAASVAFRDINRKRFERQRLILGSLPTKSLSRPKNRLAFSILNSSPFSCSKVRKDYRTEDNKTMQLVIQKKIDGIPGK